MIVPPLPSARIFIHPARRHHLALLGVLLPVAMVAATPFARAQSTLPEWSGSITANLDVDTTTPEGIHYVRHEVQTWTLTGSKMKRNGAMKLIPATWHYSGHGYRTNPAESDPQEGVVYRTWGWSVDATAKVDMVFRTANNAHIVGQWSNLATVANAMTVETMVKIESVVPLPNKLSTATAEQWAFPRIQDDDDTATTISGSGTFTVPQLGAPIGLAATSPFPATYTWSFTKNAPAVTTPDATTLGSMTPGDTTTPGHSTPTNPAPTVTAPTDRQVAQPLQPGSGTPAAGDTLPAATTRPVGQPSKTGTSALAPAISTVNPASGPRWSDALVVTFDARNTHFVQGTTTVDLGAGVTPVAIAPYQAVDIASPTKALVNAKIAGDAALGPRDVTITTGSEVVKLANAFTVTPRGVQEVFPVSPASGQAGQPSLTVTIARPTSYWSQYFYAGTQLDFGPGISVASVEVQNGSTVRATLNIAQSAATGPRTVTVTRPGFSDEKFVGAFSVTPSQISVDRGRTPVASIPPAATLESISPPSVMRGRSASFTLTGKNSHFAKGGTHASFGPGTEVTEVIVSSPTSATAYVAVGSLASTGVRSVTVTTGTEKIALDGLTITAPLGLAVTPDSMAENQPYVNVTLTGQDTHFVQGTTTVNFGTGQPVTATVLSPTSAQATFLPPQHTKYGTYTVTATTGTEIAELKSGFTYAPVPDAWGKTCGSATSLGVLNAGISQTRSGTLQLASTQDWFILSFASGCDLYLTLENALGSGGQTLFEITAQGDSCTGSVVGSSAQGKFHPVVLHDSGPHLVLVCVKAASWEAADPKFVLTAKAVPN